MAVLSIQSSVAYGHVGNAAAVFCLRRAGVDVWPVDTVAYSNHPGYGAYGGRVRGADEVAEVVDGLNAIGVLSRCRAVLTGYLGDAAAAAVLRAVATAKTANKDAFFCCDPVMGDREGGRYVTDEVAHAVCDTLVPAADVLVPNHFELETLAGRPLATLADTVAAADQLRASGPGTVVVTSLETEGTTDGEIANLLVTGDGAWMVVTPRLPLRAKGAGDALAALLVAGLINGQPPVAALERAVSSVLAVIEATVTAGDRELRLIAAQDALVAPPRLFPAQAV